MTMPAHASALSGILPGLISERLARQLAFVLEIDRLKAVFRKTTLTDGSRRESSAEHSWQLALMALVLAEYAPEEIDPLRAVTMLLVHDLVEIDAGDAFAFDATANHGKEEREQAAADRIFGLLPEDQAAFYRVAWEEFEARETAESKFANALDRLQPLLHNYATRGGTWTEFGISSERVFWRMAPIKEGAPELHELVERVVEIALAEGWITNG